MRKYLLVVFLHNGNRILPHNNTIVDRIWVASKFSASNNMHSIYMTTTVSYNKYGPTQIGNRQYRRENKKEDKSRDTDMPRNKRYTRRNRGGDKRRKNKRTEYSRKKRNTRY